MTDRMQLLVIANLRGNAEPLDPAKLRRPIELNVDNFDQVMTRLNVTWSSADLGSATFQSVHDFHPDRLFSKMDSFAQLRHWNEELADHDQCDAAIQEIVNFQQAAGLTASSEQDEQQETPTATSSSDESVPISSDNLLDQMLDQAGDDSTSPRHSSDAARLLHDLMSDLDIQRIDPRLDDCRAVIAQLSGQMMRKILGDKCFRELEAAWRGLWQLVSATASLDVQVFLLPLTAEGLSEDLDDKEDLSKSILYDCLITQAAGMQGGFRWSAATVLHQFDPDLAVDRDKLKGLASIAAASRVLTFVGISGDDEYWLDGDAAEWRELKEQMDCTSIAPVWPAYLIRRPYGAKTRSIESFEFEEMLAPSTDQLLWGFASVVPLLALASGFSIDGWDLDPNALQQIDGFPMYSYELDGDIEIQPSGRYEMSDRQARRLIEMGLTPLISVRDSDRVIVPGFRSASGKVAALNEFS